jgi:hypothetical protein|tara:strand:+ start:151 stop:423 length:273 start_codon:yes stop_codon:yes gene_type:complete
MSKVMLYKDKFPCDPLLHFDSKDAGTIEWTWRTQPPEAIYWKTYKPKKRDIKILSRVTPEQRKKVTSEIYEDIILTEHPPRVKQTKVRTL